MYNKGKGKAFQWVKSHVDYPHDWCLMWPFASRLHGYGQMSHMGKRGYAHRFMCELRHGPPPSPQHEAAHSCGRGHEGCVNPNHLSWKTKSENLLDCRQHGTQARSHAGRYGRLNHAKAAEIRALQGVALQREVAEQFAVSESTVSDIWTGRTWTREHKGGKQWTPEEDAAIREGEKLGRSFRETAVAIGRPTDGVMMRAYRIGSKSGVPRPTQHS